MAGSATGQTLRRGAGTDVSAVKLARLTPMFWACRSSTRAPCVGAHRRPGRSPAWAHESASSSPRATGSARARRRITTGAGHERTASLAPTARRPRTRRPARARGELADRCAPARAMDRAWPADPSARSDSPGRARPIGRADADADRRRSAPRDDPVARARAVGSAERPRAAGSAAFNASAGRGRASAHIGTAGRTERRRGESCGRAPRRRGSAGAERPHARTGARIAGHRRRRLPGRRDMGVGVASTSRGDVRSLATGATAGGVGPLDTRGHARSGARRHSSSPRRAPADLRRHGDRGRLAAAHVTAERGVPRRQPQRRLGCGGDAGRTDDHLDALDRRRDAADHRRDRHCDGTAGRPRPQAWPAGGGARALRRQA